MSWREFTVDLLAILLGAPVVGGAIALTLILIFREELRTLIRRLASLRFPGGELTISQADKAASDTVRGAEVSAQPAAEEPTLPRGLTLMPEDQERLVEFLKSERARAALWEYRYLNLFLVPHTQRVLDWLIALPQRTTLQMVDAFWLPIIHSPEERRAVLNALQAHHLIAIQGEMVEVTPKGREYVQWRGPSPPS